MKLTKYQIATILSHYTEFTDLGDILYRLNGGELHEDKEKDLRKAWREVGEIMNNAAQEFKDSYKGK